VGDTGGVMRRSGVIRSALAVAAAMAVMLSACGSEPADDGLATLEGAPVKEIESPGDPELAAEESVLALTECLRSEGIDIPDPEFDDQGNFRLRSLMELGEAAESIDPADMEAGVEACSHHLDGVAQIFASIDRTAIEDRLYEFAACMREQGIDMPDPDFDVNMTNQGGAGADGPFGQFDVEDPAIQAAIEACRGVFGETIGPGGFGPPVKDGGD